MKIPWAFGVYFLPAALLALYMGYYVVGTLMLGVLAFPYCIEDRRRQWWNDFLLRGVCVCVCLAGGCAGLVHCMRFR